MDKIVLPKTIKSPPEKDNAGKDSTEQGGTIQGVGVVPPPTLSVDKLLADRSIC
jgi:hypothetical protein